MHSKNFDGKLMAFIYVVPFTVLLCSCLNYLIDIYSRLSSGFSILIISAHLLFLISLSVSFGHFIIETTLAIFNDSEHSKINMILYGGKNFSPVRTFVFIGIFIACYVFLILYLNYKESMIELILFVPPIAIIINSRRLFSGKIRFINGKYMFFNGKFNVIISYYTDIRGRLVFVTNDGKLADTGTTADDTDFKALAAEFNKNGLKSGTKL